MANRPVHTLESCPKGFHDVYCDDCGGVTIHYKSGASDNAGKQVPPHCTNHSKWDGRKHAVASHVIPIDLNKIAPTEIELRRANRLDMSMWRSAEERKCQVQVDGAEWGFLFGDLAYDVSDDKDKPRDVDKIYCSFCGLETDTLHLTSEKKPKIRFKQEIIKRGDDFEVKEKAVTSVETINACPNCSLNIRKPINVRIV